MTYAEPYSSTAREWATNLKRAGNSEAPAWKAPRLFEHGKPFEPAGVEVGAFVIVTQSEFSARGQVWSEGPQASTVWVALVDEQRAVIACTKRGSHARCRHATHVRPVEDVAA